MKQLSLIVPFFNEEKIIFEKTKIIHRYLSKHYSDFELILVDDGSTDSSNLIIKPYVSKFSKMFLITSKVNKGRGNAIKKGFKKSNGKIVGYLDADLEIKITYIPRALSILKRKDIVIASKFTKGAVVKTPFIRKISSMLYNAIVNIILHTDVKDHQAGFKFFRKEVLDAILVLSHQDGWLWDIEMLYLAKKKYYTIQELPIHVRYGYRNVRSTFILDFLKMPFFLFTLKRNVDRKINYEKK